MLTFSIGLMECGLLGRSRQPESIPPAKRSAIPTKKETTGILDEFIDFKCNYIQGMSTENNDYKNAMERLESILERIDNSEMEIDELAGEVQEATELLRKCRQILLSTEKNVQEALKSLDDEDA